MFFRLTRILLLVSFKKQPNAISCDSNDRLGNIISAVTLIFSLYGCDRYTTVIKPSKTCDTLFPKYNGSKSNVTSAD